MLLLSLRKHRKLPEGTTTIKYDSKTGHAYLYKKEGGKWIYVKGQQTRGRTKTVTQKKESDFKYSMDVNVIKNLMEKRDIKTLEDLKKYVSSHPKDDSMQLYRDVVNGLRKEFTQNPKLKPMAMVALKKFGTLLTSTIRHEAPKKKRLTVDVTPKGKKEATYRRKPKTSKPASFPASSIRQAEKITGSWHPAESMPTTGEIKKMIASGNAKVLKGSPQKSGTWRLPKKLRDERYNHLLIPFRPDEKGIKVTFQQIKRNKRRDSVVASVQVTVPYAYAQQFMEKHIQTVRIRNDRIGQMKRSAGYQNSLTGKKMTVKTTKKEARTA
jgi:hypothetical protein